MRSGNNIFILVEQWLNEPNNLILKEKVRIESNRLMIEAVMQAAVKYPNKKIGADEYQLKLMDNIRNYASEAEPNSMRLVQNEKNVSQFDPAYIFKLSKNEVTLVYGIIGELLSGKTRQSPDGLIFAYDGYIERQKSSAYCYVSGIDNSIFKFYQDLNRCCVHLRRVGQMNIAAKLEAKCNELKFTIMSNKSLEIAEPNLLEAVQTIAEQIQQDEQLSKDHFIKKAVINFLLSISLIGLIGLAVTAKARHSFWYQPDSEAGIVANQLLDHLIPNGNQNAWF